MLCTKCAGVPREHLAQPVVCTRCHCGAERRGEDYSGFLAKARDLAALNLRGATRAQHRAGLKDYLRSAARWTDSPLPASGEDIAIYVTYSVTEREPTLDASTAQGYVNAVAAWHAQVQQAWGEHLVNPVRTRVAKDTIKAALAEYKKPSKAMVPLALDEWRGMWERGFLNTPQGKHQRLALLLCTLLPLRAGAAARLRVEYTVRGGEVVYAPDSHVRVVRGDPAWGKPYVLVTVGHGRYGDKRAHRDKNVSARNRRDIPIPHRALGLRPVKVLEDYLCTVQPPSGGYLLAAPVGRRGRFNTTEYKSAGSAWQRAYKRAFGKTKLRLGSGSARKSMSQWLSEAGYSWFQIKDIGGWSINDIMRKGHYIKMTIAEALEIKRDFFARLRARYAARP